MLAFLHEVAGQSSSLPGRLREPYATKFRHYIELDGQKRRRPLWIRTRRMSELETKYLNAYVEELKAIDAIEESISPWNSQVIIVPKKDKAEFRVTVNLKPLNQLIQPKAFPMPNIVDIFDKMGNARYFSVLDCAQGFLHIPLAPESRPYTAFSTPNGHWQYKVMPMGLQSAPAAWQAFMSSLFADMRAVQAYMDDLIIASYTFKEHVGSLRTVFKRFLEAGVKLKLKKCRFGEAEVSFLRHVVSRDGIRVDPEKVRAMSEFPEPSTPRKLSRFLGMIGFHRRFIPNFAKRSVALRALLEDMSYPSGKGRGARTTQSLGRIAIPHSLKGRGRKCTSKSFRS